MGIKPYDFSCDSLKCFHSGTSFSWGDMKKCFVSRPIFTFDTSAVEPCWFGQPHRAGGILAHMHEYFRHSVATAGKRQVSP